MSTERLTRRQPDTPVIHAKLTVPPLPEQRVERPALERLLASLVERNRVVVVSATAGSGKTTAVSAALRLLRLPAAWLTVDRTDSAPGRLVTYLEEALRRPLPHVAGAATDALAAAIPHAEVAGLLAEAIGDARVVFVIDELERLEKAEPAWSVIESLVRYAPGGLRVVLVSRRPIPAALHALPPGEGGVAAVGEEDLAFTPAEAAKALAQLGEVEVDPEAAVEATGGWVTGVLFEAWRSAGHVAGLGGDADPLHGYLSAHIVGQLGPEDRDFLVATSLLDEVSAPRAAALGQAHAAERLAALREARLPVTWRPDGRVLRHHSRFREYLLECLERRDPEDVRAMRLSHGRLLASEGHDEEAVEDLLRADAAEEALPLAERAIIPVIERRDFTVAERWLDALADVAPCGATPLTTAELMLAMAEEDFRRGERIADQLAALGERDALVRSSPPAAVIMAWCYASRGRFDAVEAMLAAAEPGPTVDAVRYFMAPAQPGPPPPKPEPTGTPLDALVLSISYVYGRLSELTREAPSGWVEAVAEPWRIGALSASGQIEPALELYDEVRARRVTSVGLDTWVAPQLLIDAERRDEAIETIARGRSVASASGAVLLQLSIELAEAKLALRLDRDTAAARTALDRLEQHPDGRRYTLNAEQLDMWYGLALLRESEDARALGRLRRAVDSMVTGDRILELPTAAAYLAEAEWRSGNDDAADRAADLALHAARRQGSNHVLLRALADFPAVVSRRIDAEPAADSPWHELGRALIAQGVAVEARVGALVQLQEFGRCALLVNGEEARPRITKSYELLAFLLTREGAQADREALLEALFDGRADESARAYLRQAVRWLRHVLPEGIGLELKDGRVRLGAHVAAASESTRFEAQIAEAARLQGAERLSATLDALAVYDQGEYLPGAGTLWADERRKLLADLAVDARGEAAELVFAGERYDEAERLIQNVLHADPFRETAWRLTMRIASALGDDDGVIRAYQGCERALGKLGTTPSPSTRGLLEALRR